MPNKACLYFLGFTVGLAPLISSAASPLHSGYTIITEQTAAPDLEQTVYTRIQGGRVFQGLLEILAGTGYRLADATAADPEIERLYGQPYPENQRLIGPLELGLVLERLAGSAWQLVVDPVNRRVSFELRQPYRSSGSSGSSGSSVGTPMASAGQEAAP